LSVIFLASRRVGPGRALRSRRTHRPAFSHENAVQLISQSVGRFDPRPIQCFQRCTERLERIFRKSLN
jgi:HD-GYP domain-containing protein (c-di-GMP phosphodiesterase class II)